MPLDQLTVSAAAGAEVCGRAVRRCRDTATTGQAPPRARRWSAAYARLLMRPPAGLGLA